MKVEKQVVLTISGIEFGVLKEALGNLSAGAYERAGLSTEGIAVIFNIFSALDDAEETE